MIVADTDVLIDFLAGRNPATRTVAAEIEQQSLCTTAINRFELLSGARNTQQESVIRELLDILKTLPLDKQAADRSAEIRRKLKSMGRSIGMGDSLIAGIVSANAGALLTRNRRHFERVPGLRLADLPA